MDVAMKRSIALFIAWTACNIASLGATHHTADIVIIGSGCAGLAAAGQAAAYHHSTIVLTGDKAGGQLVGSLHVDNMPGIAPQSGAKIIDQMWQHAETLGAHFLHETAVAITQTNNHDTVRYTVTTHDSTITAYAVIIATGGSPKLLGVPGEAQYLNRGIFTCAACDHMRAAGTIAYAVGGGDTAIDGTETLLKSASSCTMLVRGPRLRASLAMQKRLKKISNVTIQFNTSITAFIGDGTWLTHIDIRDYSGTITRVPASCVWEFIGFTPETTLVRTMADLHEEGHLIVDEVQHVFHHKRIQPGLFAAGDVASDHRFHQADYAAAHGKLAAQEAVRYLQSLNITKTASEDEQ